MMWFKFLKNAEVERFGNTLVDRFAQKYPSALQDDERDAARRKFQGARDSMYSQLPEFRRRVRLGMLRRAELANTVKWAMREKGYRSETIDSVVRDLLFHLAKKQA